MERKIEILAPAGSFESVIAAVRSGADAVYLGEKNFSARASAHNFDPDELKKAVAYCHIHGVKVYVTLNTLVFDDELERLKEAIILAAEADADALIVQNQGVARLAGALVPELPLHASTQMSVHTVSGVKALYEMGFKRVVLSREMSREEIKRAAEIPVELEVFVHGALCMSVSGQCYFSAMLGSRSGNRGACAQTCRLPFSVGGERGGHALSLKDNSLIPYLGELSEIGVCSAKIEGRMKRPEYVAAAVAACVEQRDFGFVTDKTSRWLKGVFSRTGFTDGYYNGKIGREMFGTRTKSDVISADDKLLSEIRRSFKDESADVDVTAQITAKLGKHAQLVVTDGKNTVKSVSDAVCEAAEKVQLTREKCVAQLDKTGGTAYRLAACEAKIDDGLSLPLSAVNRMRREAFERLDAKRSIVHNYKINNIDILSGVPRYVKRGGAVRARVTGTKLGSAFKDCELVYVPLFSDTRELERLVAEGYKIGVEVPRGMFSREEAIEKQLQRIKRLGITDVLCHNIGALYLAKRLEMTLHGGFGLNLVNTLDLLWAEEYGLKDVELSFELTFERINSLGGCIDRGVLSYGYLPLMLCRACPEKSAGISCKTCGNRSKMKDRKGMEFILKCDGICTEVLNGVPLLIAGEEISRLSTSFHVLRFSVEKSVETVEKLTDFNDFSMLKGRFTHGLYRRGVE